MNGYGKTLAHTGSVTILGMTAGWTLAAAAVAVGLGAVLVRVAFRRSRAIGQR